MSAQNATIFAYQDMAYRLLVAFRDTSGNLIKNWTGAACVIVIDGVLYTGGDNGTPTEVSGTGMGYLDLNAAQMNGYSTTVACTVTNANSTASVFAIPTSAPYTISGPELRPMPDDPIAAIRWLFRYLYNTANVPLASGILTIANDDGTTMTEISTNGTDTAFNKFKSSP